MSTVVSRNPRTAWRRVQQEVLIISSDTNSLTVLNDTAARIWELLEGGRSVEDLAIALSTEYDIEKEAAQRDVATFIADLCERDLVRIGEG